MRKPPDFALEGGALDALMPMHLWFGADERVIRVGPTLAKICLLYTSDAADE